MLWDTYTDCPVVVESRLFSVPLVHDTPNDETITVGAKLVSRQYTPHSKDKYILYLQGGPGYSCPFPSKTSPVFLEPMLRRGYTVVLLDQRGTGLSEPVDVGSLVDGKTPEEQLEYILNFRADSIVKDAEMIRKILLGETQWLLLGQSYGSFCSLCYLSMFPKSIKCVFLTGGVPPLLSTRAEVVNCQVENMRKRCQAYFSKYKEDRERLDGIHRYLDNNKVYLPNGSQLTVARFKGVGSCFGVTGGALYIHSLITTMALEIQTLNSLTYNTKNSIMQCFGSETNILYFLFQQVIYMNGPGHLERFSQEMFDELPFTIEMFHSEMLTDPVFQPLAPLVDELYRFSNWKQIWDLESLKSIRWDDIPVVAASFVGDIYVDFNLGQRLHSLFEFKDLITNIHCHDGVKADPNIVEQLFHILENGNYM